MPERESHSLVRGLGLIGAACIVVGGIIGTGVFPVPVARVNRSCGGVT